ncbi:MAG TPA: hypothetical protein VIW92_03210 [Thermoanaerobaculia bacterium]
MRGKMSRPLGKLLAAAGLALMAFASDPARADWCQSHSTGCRCWDNCDYAYCWCAVNAGEDCGERLSACWEECRDACA